MEDGRPDRSHLWWGTTAALAAVVAIASAVVFIQPRPAVADEGLSEFDSCSTLLDYAKSEALQRVTAWGLDGGYRIAYPDMIVSSAEEGRATANPAGDSAAPFADHSATNVQEAGVDEADLVKTDGRRIVVVADTTLYVLSPDLDVLSTLDLADQGWFSSMFLIGDRVVLLGSRSAYSDPMAGIAVAPPDYYVEVTAVVEVDISDAAHSRVVRSTYIDGRYLSARLHGGVVRVVIASYPTGLEFSSPQGPGLRAERVALAHNRRVIEMSTIDNWLPYFYQVDDLSGVESDGLLLGCDKAHHPAAFSGFGMLTIASFSGGEVVDAAGIMAAGETVYASQEAFYVATMVWEQLSGEEVAAGAPADASRTEIHAFAIDGARVDYAASGSVPGTLLNQFAMSEYGGYLRVASTTGGAWDGQSESVVTVLRRSGTSLIQEGQVGGLGEGEDIFAVRFLGDTGYVVTFRQTDPLYVLDLSDPTFPRVTGELKIAGYSAYLHPVSEGTIIGVGQDATDEGSITGTQVALFDVSDPTDPHRLYRYRLDGAGSAVEWDHRAFLLYGDTVVIPVDRGGMIIEETWPTGTPEAEAPFLSGALVLRMGEDGFREVGLVEQQGGVLRSLVIGDRLYLVGGEGIQAVALQDLRRIAEMSFFEGCVGGCGAEAPDDGSPGATPGV
jgi:uncharacterized secreted protein with C-terminal beta-propeller domain